MINSVAPVANTGSAALAAPVTQKASEVKPQSGSGIQDTVQLSSVAHAHVSAIKAASQEAAETPAQTSQEARSGDHQAQRLLAKQAAAKLTAK